MLDDDDDRFLYGDSADIEEEPPKPAPVETSVPQPIPLEQVETAANTSSVVADLEAKVSEESNGDAPDGSEAQDNAENGEGQDEDEDEEDEEEESDDDIEIITEKPTRSLDFRQRPSLGRPGQPSSFATPRPQQPTPSLTTEYTPRERGANLSATPQPGLGPSTSQASTHAGQATSEQRSVSQADGVDPSKLPVATAPPSHPQIDLDTPGILDGHSILEIDLNALAEKNWRRPGADISDWFNYGFDEISWEAYCYRRREVNELANVLKANVLSFAGMPEEQVAALPPEVRTMIMAMVASGGGNGGGMMQPGMNMNGPMMGGMMPMGGMMDPTMMHQMGPGDMGMVGQGMGMGMGDGMGGQQMPGPGMGGQGMVGPSMNNGALSGGVAISSGGQGRATPDVPMGMMGDGFQGGPQGPQGMGMAGGNDFGMQQEMYPGTEGAGTPAPSSTPTRGGTPGHYGRGRGGPVQPATSRGTRGGSYSGRGRALPVRPASPLPPNVPTGPRNKNKYKDIDNSAPAVDGLDYGGGKDRSTPPDYDDRNSRKRRSSPGLDDRGSKRR